MMHPQKPVANSGGHGSGKGILENKIPASTRSVHFSAETTRQSRGFSPDNGNTLVRSERTLSESFFLTSKPGEIDLEANEGAQSASSSDRAHESIRNEPRGTQGGCYIFQVADSFP